MKNPIPYNGIVVPFSLILFILALPLYAQSNDASVMADLKKSLKLPSNVVWSGPDPCNNWNKVSCESSRGTHIQLGNLSISGTLPPSLSSLTNLKVLELMHNKISGQLPSLARLSSLETLNLMSNQFTSIPPNFFTGMSALQYVYLDKNPFANWSIPNSLQDASSLVNFSANSANLVGSLPEFNWPNGLINLQLAFNHLEGGLPASFSGLTLLQSLWLSGQNFTNGSRSLDGSIAVLQNMTDLVQVWLNMNLFTGPIPDLSKHDKLADLNLRDNSLTGPIPESLTDLKSLKIVNLTNNCLQGPTPKFSDSVSLDVIDGTNSFCVGIPGSPCDSRVDVLISFLEPFGYPFEFAQDWKGNDPCSGYWMGITCIDSNITVINLKDKGLSGSISASIARLTSVETLILAGNNITGTIPDELATMPNLKLLDVSDNNLYGKVPSFDHTKVNTTGNVNIGKDPPPSFGSTPRSSSSNASGTGNKSNTGKIIGILIGIAVVVVVVVVGLAVFWCGRRRNKTVSSGFQRPKTVVINPSHPEAGNNLVISIQVLRNVTNNFSENNVLGKGGFGSVYKGELHDNTKIAVKRMDPGALGDKGLAEFTAEIAVLTKVRHRNLVSLLGYCLDGNEKILVYEYMPQGTLSQHLFARKECESKPLEWKQRLSIALDVARGVEYLHNLAHQSFIHRDLKPSNILLGDDMRAKVSDFGLVRLAQNGGKASVQTRLAGTFGYLTPEYAVLGRITTKVDVYAFVVILMELITGRKALDETQPEESIHLVTWFRKMYTSSGALQRLVDPTIELNDETSTSIHTIAELASHCCARDPQQRPEMGHTVNVISSSVEMWKPSILDPEDDYGIDLEMSLPQALKKWQAVEGTSSIDDSGASSFLFDSAHNTLSSIPLMSAVEDSTFVR